MLTLILSQHVKNHTKPRACHDCDRRFATPSDLNRHVKARHRVRNELFPCSYPNCNFKTTRKDNLSQHALKRHQHKPGIDQQKSIGEQKDEQDLLLLRRAHMFQLAESGNIAYMETLLKAGAVLDIQGDDGSTLLHCSARAGQTNMVKYLLHQKANVNQMNSEGRTPLHEAVASGNQEIVELLLEHRADSTLKGWPIYKSATYYAVVAGRVDITQRLLEMYGSERAIEVAHLLLAAIEANESSVVELLLFRQEVLLEKGIMLQALRKACKHGSTGSVSQLLELDNIDVNTILSYRCPLYWASIRGHIETVSLLLGHKDIHIDDDIVLKIMEHWSRFKPPKKRLDILRLLLQHPNFNVNPADCSMITMLHKATRSGLADGVRMLFDCKDLNIDINARNDRSETALQIARQMKKRFDEDFAWAVAQRQAYEEIIGVLLAQGALEDTSDSKISTSNFDGPTIISSDVKYTSMGLSDLSDPDEEVDMYYDGEASDITAIRGSSRPWDL
jgi:ankyrin repeat protein